MSTTQAMTITVLGSGATVIPAALAVIEHSGQHATTPIPAGNVLSGVSGTNLEEAITPTSSGSALWMITADWNQTNSYVEIADCTIDQTYDVAGQHTAALIRPTIQPRTDASTFTIGESDTGGKIAWIALEVQAAASSFVPRGMLLGVG